MVPNFAKVFRVKSSCNGHYFHKLLDQLDVLYAEQWEDLVARVLQSPETELDPWKITWITWEAISGE